MANKNITIENNNSVIHFLNTVENENKRKDCLQLLDEFIQATGFAANMWGTAIIGFGSYHYTYDSGRTGDAPLAGFSPRKNAIVLYLSSEFEDREALLSRFGKHTTGKACIYIKKLTDVDLDVLKQMINNSVAYIKKCYP